MDDPQGRADLIKELLKQVRKHASLPAYRDPKEFDPCPDAFWASVGAVDSQCPVCEAWEFGAGWPLGVHCTNLCLHPKWFVDEFHTGLMEAVFRVEQEKKDIETMEDKL